MTETLTVHVAAKAKTVRRSLRSTLELYGFPTTVEITLDGIEGAPISHQTQPEIIVLVLEAGADARSEVLRYRKAVPRAYIVGFTFSEIELDSFWEADVDDAVVSSIGRAGFYKVLQKAERVVQAAWTVDNRGAAADLLPV